MLRIAVVDDNAYDLQNLSNAIRDFFSEADTVDTFEGSVIFSENKEKYLYDIVFLDIEMPDMSGFQLAESIKFVNKNVIIVFVSNHENYILGSFEFEPLCFVRKSSIMHDMELCLKIYNKKYKKSNEQFFLQTKEWEKHIPIDSIAYFEKMGHDLYVKISNDKFKIKRTSDNELTMTKLTDQLSRKGFIRVHRSFLVNYKFIYLIHRNEIELKNKETVPINFRNVNEIKNIYQSFLIAEE